MPDLDAFQDRLGYRFENIELLKLALTHPSTNREREDAMRDNQRLEFLGDAVLQLVLTEELYGRFPSHEEGSLSKARARLVNQAALAEQARSLDLGAHVFLSRPEEAIGGRDRPSTLADAFEAVLGAIYLDGGFSKARELILRQFEGLVSQVESLEHIDNPKGELQELLQAQSPEGPEYRLLSVVGPDHDRTFDCAVYYRGEEVGRGTGKSKKAAESLAAAAALSRIRQTGSAA